MRGPVLGKKGRHVNANPHAPLAEPRDSPASGHEFEAIVVSSGFGGAAIACRALAGRKVAILERGQECPGALLPADASHGERPVSGA